MRFSSVQSLSRVQLFVTPWTAAHRASLSITNSWSLLKLTSIESVMPSNHLILCCPLLLLPQSHPAWGSFQMCPFFTSGGQSIGVSAAASVLPMNIEDWFPLGLTDWISLQNKEYSSLIYHHNSKASICRHSAFLWSNSHIHTWLLEKTIALTRQTFIGKVMSLLFNMLSRLIIIFLPRNKHLLISWLQSPSAVILQLPTQKKSVTVSTASHLFTMK